jgi:hypothetical protein
VPFLLRDGLQTGWTVSLCLALFCFHFVNGLLCSRNARHETFSSLRFAKVCIVEVSQLKMTLLSGVNSTSIGSPVDLSVPLFVWQECGSYSRSLSIEHSARALQGFVMQSSHGHVNRKFQVRVSSHWGGNSMWVTNSLVTRIMNRAAFPQSTRSHRLLGDGNSFMIFVLEVTLCRSKLKKA